jgi:hypothetical protein
MAAHPFVQHPKRVRDVSTPVDLEAQLPLPRGVVSAASIPRDEAATQVAPDVEHVVAKIA